MIHLILRFLRVGILKMEGFGSNCHEIYILLFCRRSFIILMVNFCSAEVKMTEGQTCQRLRSWTKRFWSGIHPSNRRQGHIGRRHSWPKVEVVESLLPSWILVDEGVLLRFKCIAGDYFSWAEYHLLGWALLLGRALSASPDIIAEQGMAWPS